MDIGNNVSSFVKQDNVGKTCARYECLWNIYSESMFLVLIFIEADGGTRKNCSKGIYEGIR